jgi:hypothetical protein
MVVVVGCRLFVSSLFLVGRKVCFREDTLSISMSKAYRWGLGQQVSFGNFDPQKSA